MIEICVACILMSYSCCAVLGLSEAGTSRHTPRLSSGSLGYCGGCRWQRADVTESCRCRAESLWSLCSVTGYHGHVTLHILCLSLQLIISQLILSVFWCYRFGYFLAWWKLFVFLERFHRLALLPGAQPTASVHWRYKIFAYRPVFFIWS